MIQAAPTHTGNCSKCWREGALWFLHRSKNDQGPSSVVVVVSKGFECADGIQRNHLNYTIFVMESGADCN